MNDMIKFAVVGLGNIGERHLAVIEAQSQAKLVSICDIVPGRAEHFASEYSVQKYFDFNAMLHHTDADVINICTPHGLHAPMAIAAAQAGKHVLVEKPMALSVREAEEMIEAGRANNIHLMVVKQNRYNVPIALTTKALDEGRLGKIFMVECNVLWNRHPAYYQASNWRGRKALEGGALHTQVSHFLDLMIWWFGDVVHSTAEIATKNQNIEIEDCGTALLRFSSGVMGSLVWTTNVYNKNFEGSISIIGEHGLIKIGGQYLNKIDFWDVLSYPLPDDIQFTDKPNSYGKYQGTSSNHDKVMSDVVTDLLQERHDVVSGDEGIRTIRAIEKIYHNATVVC